jgi:DNA mismatch endonuclease (patch repair protein)
MGKFKRNKERDFVVTKALVAAGWRVAVVWECQIKDSEELKQNLTGLVRGGINAGVDESVLK